MINSEVPIQILQNSKDQQIFSTELYQAILNDDFKYIFKQTSFQNTQDQNLIFLLRYYIRLASKLTRDFQGTIKLINQSLINVLQIQESETLLWTVFHILFKLFIKQNWVGNDYLHIDANKHIKINNKLAQQLMDYSSPQYVDYTNQFNYFKIEKLEDLHIFDYHFIKLKRFICATSKQFMEFLELNGEPFNQSVHYQSLFIVLRCFIDQFNKESFHNALINARFYYFYNTILDTPASIAYEQVVKSYNKCVEHIEKYLLSLIRKQVNLQKEFISTLYIEMSHTFLFYYKYSKSKFFLEKAQILLQTRFEFTGQMGVRTKFQTQKMAQLVVISKLSLPEEFQQHAEKEDEDLPDIKELVQQELLKCPDNVPLGEDCVIFDNPILDPDQEKSDFQALNIYQQILGLGKIAHIEKTTPHDEIYYEQIQAFASILMEKSLNWLVFSASLLVRSLNEFIKFKRMERSMVQMQALVDQYNDKDPKSGERSIYVHALNYPSYYELQKKLADFYMKIGAVMSSCEIYFRLGLEEECVECLYMAGHKDRAQEKADEMFKKGKTTPKLLCIYGDIVNDYTYYKKAWKTSNKRFARAVRQLGKHYYYKNELAKSIKYLLKASKINSYHGDTWYMLGCAQMRTDQLQPALQSFAQVVSIDESQGEAWANLAGCYIKQGRKLEALGTLEQAVKFCENNWRIWGNLMNISLQSKKFWKFLMSIEKLVQLNHREMIDEGILIKVNQTFRYTISQLETKPISSVMSYQRAINRLFDYLSLEIGGRPDFWDCYSELYYSYILFEEIKEMMEKNGQVVDYKSEDKKNYENKICEFRLKSCQTAMKIGYEGDKKTCGQLLELVLKMIKDYKKVGRIGELELFLKQMKQTLELTLEKQIDLD